MKESFWMVFVVMMGIISLLFIFVFQSLTNTDEHNYNMLKETTEAAMIDAFDLASYRYDGTIRIDREKFVENFYRRFAENANLSRVYNIKIYDVNECPPKVSIQLSTSEKGNATGENIEFNLTNRLDAILETPY